MTTTPMNDDALKLLYARAESNELGVRNKMKTREEYFASRDADIGEAKAAIQAIIDKAVVDELERLLQTELPWPEDVFGEVPKGEWHEIDEFAKTRGYRIDTISGTLMRRGWKCYERVIREEIAQLQPHKQEEQ